MARKAVVAFPLAGWWQNFQQLWDKCNACPLHRCRDKIVFFRGRLPADILLIGEAPGQSENLFGLPFVGDAGRYLDGLLIESGLNPDDLCFTNTVCCVPHDETGELRDPAPNEIKACNLRLVQFWKACQPKLVIYVGHIAAAASKGITGWFIGVRHPSWIMQRAPHQEPLERRRFILSVNTAVREMRADNAHS